MNQEDIKEMYGSTSGYDRLKARNADRPGSSAVTIVPYAKRKEMTLDQIMQMSIGDVRRVKDPIARIHFDFEGAKEVLIKVGKHLNRNFDFNIHAEFYENLLCYMFEIESPLDINKGLYLYGLPGTGKTEILKIIQVFSNSFPRCGHLKNRMLNADEIVDRFMTHKNYEAISHIAGKSLSIDDIGQERVEVNLYGNKVCIVEKILMYSYPAWQKGNMILNCTSNYVPERITELYGERVSSRLHQMMNMVKLKCNDLRKMESKK